MNTKPHESVCRDPTLGLRRVVSKSPLAGQTSAPARPPYLDPSRFLFARFLFASRFLFAWASAVSLKHNHISNGLARVAWLRRQSGV
jgi:hypothetical protein